MYQCKYRSVQHNYNFRFYEKTEKTGEEFLWEDAKPIDLTHCHPTKLRHPLQYSLAKTRGAAVSHRVSHSKFWLHNAYRDLEMGKGEVNHCSGGKTLIKIVRSIDSLRFNQEKEAVAKIMHLPVHITEGPDIVGSVDNLQAVSSKRTDQ